VADSPWNAKHTKHSAPEPFQPESAKVQVNPYTPQSRVSDKPIPCFLRRSRHRSSIYNSSHSAVGARQGNQNLCG
jgi:hypothetical protein